jgi:hypothetical protein
MLITLGVEISVFGPIEIPILVLDLTLNELKLANVFYYQSLNSDGVKDPFFTSSCFVYF